MPRVRWSWGSAAIGAASTAAAAALIVGRPRDPTFRLISINLLSFHLNRPFLDLELVLTVHVTNPNLVAIHYEPATMSIFYDGSCLGTAQVQAGSQPPMSCSFLDLHAHLNGVQIAHHAAKILADAARREMSFDASVDISGTAQVLWWHHRFSVHVDSHVVVDPIFLEIIDQENNSETHVLVA